MWFYLGRGIGTKTSGLEYVFIPDDLLFGSIQVVFLYVAAFYFFIRLATWM